MSSQPEEVTLDPENWDEMTALGHRMLDDAMEYLKTIREQPYLPLSEEAKNAIITQLPDKGDGEAEVYDVFKEHIVPYSVKWIRPDFWGFVIGTGSPFGMLTDMVISGTNSSAGAGPMTFINNMTIDWIKELLEYPEEAGGVFVNGGSEANFTGLAVARNAKAEVDMKAEGMQGVQRKMTLYCSEEAHHCLERSVELLGLGNDAMRWIKTDDSGRIVIDDLRDSINEDREKGYHPFCVIGNAGTVNSGAFDDLNCLADLCEKENLWFHVDGAFGAWVKLSEKYKHLADGLERADSLAVDFHKWMNMPFTLACTLVRDREAHFSTFVYGHTAEYARGVLELSDDLLRNPHHLCLALSKPVPWLKAYMLLRAYGRERYSKLVEQNIDQIHYLAELIEKEPNMEITAPVASNIVCFRYIKDGLCEDEVEKLNRSILNELWKINLWMISDTKIKGMYMLRACNVNHRSRYSDFDILVERIKSIGKTLAKEYT
jgi:aromatic-L-amino-acid decarboxylase